MWPQNKRHKETKRQRKPRTKRQRKPRLTEEKKQNMSKVKVGGLMGSKGLHDILAAQEEYYHGLKVPLFPRKEPRPRGKTKAS